MFRLSRMADYAVVLLGQLARESDNSRADGRAATAVHLAAATGLPEPTVAKIAKQLARAGLLTSKRGAAGGYGLARPAAAISVGQVIEAVDGPIAMTACVEGAHDQCSVESLCPMRGNWARVNEAVRGALEAVSIAEMSVPARFAGGVQGEPAMKIAAE